MGYTVKENYENGNNCMFDKKKDENGIIRVPKEQGTFIAIK